MLVVVSYDIGDERRRNRVARLLEGFGARVLESVYECDLTSAQWAKLERRLRREVDLPADQVRAYLLCERCVEQTRVLAGPPVERSPSTYIV